MNMRRHRIEKGMDIELFVNFLFLRYAKYVYANSRLAYHQTKAGTVRSEKSRNSLYTG